MKLTIKVTKEILERSKMCGEIENSIGRLNTHCAIALAARDIFPNAIVEQTYIAPFPKKFADYMGSKAWGDQHIIELPLTAIGFISSFDRATPEVRVKMPELEFTVDIPDNVIEQINIDEIKPLLENHPTLSLA